MNRYVLTRLLPPLVGVLLLTGLGVVLSGRGLVIDSSAETLLATDPRNLETFEALHDLIPETVMVMTALKMHEVFSDEGAAVIAEASERMLSVGGAQEVKSLTHSGRPVRRGFRLAIEPFIPLRAEAEEWRELRAFNTRFPMSRNVLVSEDAQYAVLLGIYERELPDHAAREGFRREFTEAMEEIDERVERMHVLSFPFVEAEGYNAVREDLTRYLMFAAVLIPVVLIVTFRSVTAVVYVLLMEVAGILALGGIFLLFGRAVDLYTGILFPLTAGLQLTFVTHHVAALQRAGKTMPAGSAASAALREVFFPGALAAVTTSAGLGTLALSDLPMVADFGRLGAVGVPAVFLVTFAVPGVLELWSSTRGSRETVAEPSTALIPWVRRRGAVFAGFAVLTGVMLSGATRMRTDVRAMEFIEPGHSVRETLELLNEDLGGMNIFQLEVDTHRAGGVQELEMLKYFEAMREYAYTLEGVTDAYAYSQLYIALNQIWEGETRAEGRLPEDPRRLQLFSNLLDQTAMLFEDAFVAEDASSTLMVLRSRDMPGREYLAMLQMFLERAEAEKPEGVSLKPVRGLHTILEQDRRIVENQARSLGLSLAVIALLLGVLWRSPFLSGCVLLANLPAMATLFGVMGWTGFPLNSVTVMAAAVILGIAVDDGIHLVSYYRGEMRRGRSAGEAASAALRVKLKPVACTSAILTVFLGLLVLASFPPVAHFGILGASGLLLGFCGAVFLLPALLRGRGISGG